MGDAKNLKSERSLTPAEAAEMLRRLAQQFETGSVEIGPVTVELDQLLEFKQSVKTKPDKVSFKLKLKYEKSLMPAGLAPEGHPALTGDEEEEEFEGEEALGRPKYKSLKKHMSSSLKAIKASLGRGELPEVEVVHSLTHDCHLMCTFPGKGDAHYPEFIALADALLAAAEAGDLAGVQQALTGLDARKKACHGDHK
ncbi:MAG: GAK system XXXCH domain-containing protein [Thermodesulfobacteriota bacterium]